MRNTINKTTTAHKRHCFLDSMRAVAIIMVVGVHSQGYSLELPSHQALIVSYIIHKISVPIFFLVDGYIFAEKNPFLQQNWYPDFIKKSFYRLVVPWIIFTVLYALARYSFEITNYLNDKLILEKSWDVIAVNVYGSVVAPQMYFLLSLFIIRLLAPILKVTISGNNLSLLFASIIIYFIAYETLMPSITPILKINGGQEPILHALWGLKFYLIGFLISSLSREIDINRMLIPCVSATVLAIYLQEELNFNLSKIIQVTYLISFFVLFYRFKLCFSFLNYLGKNTMGIYLIHAPIVLKLISILTHNLTTIPLLSYFFVWSATLVVSIILLEIIKKHRLSNFLFGTNISTCKG